MRWKSLEEGKMWEKYYRCLPCSYSSLHACSQTALGQVTSRMEPWSGPKWFTWTLVLFFTLLASLYPILLAPCFQRQWLLKCWLKAAFHLHGSAVVAVLLMSKSLGRALQRFQSKHELGRAEHQWTFRIWVFLLHWNQDGWCRCPSRNEMWLCRWVQKRCYTQTSACTVSPSIA